MDNGSFHIDGWALLWMAAAVPVLGWLLSRWRRERPLPLFYFSSTATFNARDRSWRSRLGAWPKRLGIAALLAFLLALADPHLRLPLKEPSKTDQTAALDEQQKEEEVELPTEGIAIYLLLDQSGSMAKEVDFTSGSGATLRLPRMEVLKRVTAQFIKGDPVADLPGRRDDLIGLVAFARVATILSPLTLDHRYVLTELAQLKAVTRPEADGTAMGYAIFKTVNLIAATRYFAGQLKGEERPAYEIKSQVLVLVTDGFHYPSPLDKGNPQRTMGLLEAASHAKEQGVRLYIVDIEPAIARPEYHQEITTLRQAAEVTGGRFFLAGLSKSLSEVYGEIDQLERTQLPGGRKATATVEEEKVQSPDGVAYRRFPFHPYLVGLGLFLLFLGTTLHHFFVRRVP